MELKKPEIEPGTPKADPKYSITVMSNGPYLVFGSPQLKQDFISTNNEGEAWDYKAGKNYTTEKEPTALCRCGASKNKPYCDGSHTTAKWDPTLTAGRGPLLDNAETYKGPELELNDNPKYCARARFCMAKNSVWELTGDSDNPQAKETAIRETFLCPSGRLKIIDREKSEFLEPGLSPSLSLLEDSQMHCSGPLWVKGGIHIEDEDKKAYETRNRVSLCRCGASKNKPYCDGSHIEAGFEDGLPVMPEK